LKPGIQEIGEKEKFQDNKDNEELNQDNGPELPADGHFPEAVYVKVPDAL